MIQVHCLSTLLHSAFTISIFSIIKGSISAWPDLKSNAQHGRCQSLGTSQRLSVQPGFVVRRRVSRPFSVELGVARNPSLHQSSYEYHLKIHFLPYGKRNELQLRRSTGNAITEMVVYCKNARKFVL